MLFLFLLKPGWSPLSGRGRTDKQLLSLIVLNLAHASVEAVEVVAAVDELVTRGLLQFIEFVNIFDQCENYNYNEDNLTNKVETEILLQDTKRADGVAAARTRILKFLAVTVDARTTEGVLAIL